MSKYLLSVIGIVLFCSVLSVILPQGKTSKIVTAISRLACIVAIIAPIPAYLTGENQTFFGETSISTDDAFIKYCSELRIDEAENLLEKKLREEYAEDLALTLYWGWEEEKVAIYRAVVESNSLSSTQKERLAKQIYDDYKVEVTFDARKDG